MGDKVVLRMRSFLEVETVFAEHYSSKSLAV